MLAAESFPLILWNIFIGNISTDATALRCYMYNDIISGIN